MSARPSVSVRWAVPWVVAPFTYGLMWSTFPVLVVFDVGAVYWETGLVFGLVGVGYLAVRHRRLAVVVLVTSPYCVTPVRGVVEGVHDYLDGTAYLRRRGLLAGHDLDPELRIYAESSGCVVDGSEPLFNTPYNAVVSWMIRTWGPMPGAYDGPYPDADAAFMWLGAHGQAVAVSDFEAGQVSVAGQVFSTARVGRVPPGHTLLAAQYSERLLLIGEYAPGLGLPWVRLVDLQSDEHIARYSR
ncbi:MAG: hypothetical protein K0V04_00460 [Deltaproteobacteria bacterium]|nr:hypothetical protein [Deltaproteobacteria bacterium]